MAVPNHERRAHEHEDLVLCHVRRETARRSSGPAERAVRWPSKLCRWRTRPPATCESSSSSFRDPEAGADRRSRKGDPDEHDRGDFIPGAGRRKTHRIVIDAFMSAGGRGDENEQRVIASQSQLRRIQFGISSAMTTTACCRRERERRSTSTGFDPSRPLVRAVRSVPRTALPEKRSARSCAT